MYQVRAILTGLVILITHVTLAQAYEEQMDKAEGMLQEKKYCNALEIFKAALQDTAKSSAYDLFFGAVSAVKCNDETLSLFWLTIAQQKGLGLKPGEINYLNKDSTFLKLHKYPEWTKLISSMQQSFSAKQERQKKESEVWVQTIFNNRIKPNFKGKFKHCKPGFALYFTKVDTLKVPYLVYVPKEYNPEKPTKAVIYLHGGVVNTDSFDFKNPQIQKEPIFSIGNTFNVILIYPFGKKDFGWVNQKAAFQNIYTILKTSQAYYKIDTNNVFLGGMSNGGTAMFWFASQQQKIFKGFYAFSAFPKLAIGEINFQDITPDKPLYSVNAKDDDVYNFEKVKEIYEAHKLLAKGWHFESIESGGHGFIYKQH